MAAMALAMVTAGQARLSHAGKSGKVLDRQVQLFVDDFRIDRMDGLTRGLHWQVNPVSPVVPSTASGDTFGIMQDPVLESDTEDYIN